MPPFTKRSPLFIGSEIYRGSSYGAGHPLRVPRVSTVMDLCRSLGWLPPDRYRTSPRAKPAALAAWHTSDYIAALQLAEATGDLPARKRGVHPGSPDGQTTTRLSKKPILTQLRLFFD